MHFWWQAIDKQCIFNNLFVALQDRGKVTLIIHWKKLISILSSLWAYLEPYLQISFASSDSFCMIVSHNADLFNSLFHNNNVIFINFLSINCHRWCSENLDIQYIPLSLGRYEYFNPIGWHLSNIYYRRKNN